ncbi:Scr1 family TA system antitoxin-like transcriptional regulator [Nocardiopsis mangrovi]|uniref:Scr1 family TA system antitoxin-like transcriptional regulator n=1 Tax=Nocardiopsis mangrovi TaxID=1179818 RepID=A0ABV9DSV1_9ACTN
MTKECTPEERDAARNFARKLRELRKIAHLSQTELAERMRVARQTIGKYESGLHVPTRDFAVLADEALGTEGLFAGFLPSPEGEHRKLLKRYVHIEQSKATSLQQWQAQVVPALLQTEEYAREVLTVSIPPRMPDEVDKFVASQMARQDVLWRKHPIEAHFIIGEAAATQLVGGRDVMRRQWAKLIEWSANPYVTLQVLPRSVGAHASMQGAYTILEIEALKWAVYVETMAGGEVITGTQTVTFARRRFGALMAHALSPRDTVKLLSELQQEEEAA